MLFISKGKSDSPSFNFGKTFEAALFKQTFKTIKPVL
jgi:hypothetical protein